jgi:hypothetical protein
LFGPVLLDIAERAFTRSEWIYVHLALAEPMTDKQPVLDTVHKLTNNTQEDKVKLLTIAVLACLLVFIPAVSGEDLKSVVLGGTTLLIPIPPGYVEILPESEEYKNRIYLAPNDQRVRVLALFERTINDVLTIASPVSSEQLQVTREMFGTLIVKFREGMKELQTNKEHSDAMEQYRAYFSHRSGLTFSLPKETLIDIKVPDDLSTITQTIKVDSWTDPRGKPKQQLELETEITMLVKGKIITAGVGRTITKEGDQTEALIQAQSWLKDLRTVNGE